MSSSINTLNRRQFMARLAAVIGALSAPLSAAAQERSRFSHDQVVDAARALASMPFVPPPLVPERLLDLSYDEYRQIRFRKEKAVWGNTRSPFSAELFPVGGFFESGIDIYIVESGEALTVPVDAETFITPSPELAELLGSIQQLAGFRLHYPINTTEYDDEFLVFQGASYFRAVSAGQNYGLSARGLAIDVAEPTGEEFPLFRRFWIERPSPNSENIVVHALLDSQRVTGAYRFGVFPGAPTRVDISCTLFPRTTLEHVGIAPLTSMFLFGDLDPSDLPDYRPAVHDSHLLAIHNGNGERLLRPLFNPPTLQVSAFLDQNPQGFGLLQRRRRFEDFQDLQALYHRRPTAWITPRGDWGAGHVTLVEIPTESEVNDNIVAYWRPATPLEPGQAYEYRYQLSWPDDSELPAGFARLQRSAYGLKFATNIPELVLDWQGLPQGLDPADFSIEATIGGGTILETITEPNGVDGLRAYVSFDPGNVPVSELRIQPRHRGQSIGETLLYRWLAR